MDKVVKMATVVEGDQKDPFSIATTLRYRGGRYSFPDIAPLYLLIRTLYCCVLSKKVSSTIFKVFGMTRPGIEPRSPEPLGHICITTTTWYRTSVWMSYIFTLPSYVTPGSTTHLNCCVCCLEIRVRPHESVSAHSSYIT